MFVKENQFQEPVSGNSYVKKITAVIAGSLLVAACSTTPEKPAADQAANAAADKPAQAATQGQASAEQNAASQMDVLKNDSIYFDFDKYDVKPAYRDAAKREAQWMLAHKKDIVTLEGNTDDRGSDEYNLALGNKRAHAVHRMLTAMGVPSSRIKDVSFGESKPRATCEEEKCWQENRRVDFAHKLN